ncbi:hypothetical protein C4D60_Mb09t01160 [Musa balbisiana]|uniref:Uncharacterized protein n=1 Tax=Musa balbisiana TaxID=52838 RepID=A0A4S8ID50_MUSBA|nr:hypothetical protein C4D60_Mb09t01160 [Musa balbisiana]
MANSLRLFFALLLLLLLLLCIVHRGLGATCGVSDIAIRQRKTGATVEGKPEYQVLVSNECRCPQSKVVLRCYGLSSVEAVNRRAIRAVDEERCIVADGRPVTKGTPVKFKYAWMTPQDFPVVSSLIHCH